MKYNVPIKIFFTVVTIFPLVAMHPIPAGRLKLLREQMVEELDEVIFRGDPGSVVYREGKKIITCSYEESIAKKVAIFHKYNQEITKIVHDDADLLTNQEKLHLMVGDGRREKRKKNIKQMIEVEHVDPNTITEDADHANPLYGALVHEDHSFFCYLLDRGANPNDAILALLKDKRYADQALFWEARRLMRLPIFRINKDDLKR